MPPARIQAAIQYPSAERPNVKKPSTTKTRTPRGIKDIIMRERSLQTADDASRLVQESGLSHIKIGLSDIDGVMSGTYLSKDQFLTALTSGQNGIASCRERVCQVFWLMVGDGATKKKNYKNRM